MSTPIINIEPLIKSHWSEEDKRNARLVLQFVQTLMNDHDFVALKQTFTGHQYRQHNRTIADGLDGVIDTISQLTKSSPEFSYEVKHLYVDGDSVILHSHATLKASHRGDEKEGFNIMDVWRVEAGDLVEHWDCIQGLNFSMRLYALMTGGKVANENGVF